MFFRSKKDNGKDARQPLPATLKSDKAAATPPSEASGRKGGAPSTAAPVAVEAKSLAPEELKARAEASQRLAATIGEIVGLMLRSPRHRDHKISDLRWLVLPAVRAGQYALMQAQSKSHGFTTPVAAVLWARVSADVDKRLEEKLDEPIRLGPREWRSGDIFWLVEAIGDNHTIAALVRRLRDSDWKGKSVKARVSDAKGQVKVRLIQTQAAANGAPAR
jgi:hemolysin-activating ACP:hemolysin acyltransferase